MLPLLRPRSTHDNATLTTAYHKTRSASKLVTYLGLAFIVFFVLIIHYGRSMKTFWTRVDAFLTEVRLTFFHLGHHGLPSSYDDDEDTMVFAAPTSKSPAASFTFTSTRSGLFRKRPILSSRPVAFPSLPILPIFSSLLLQVPRRFWMHGGTQLRGQSGP
jgi:hypothetical protein